MIMEDTFFRPDLLKHFAQYQTDENTYFASFRNTFEDKYTAFMKLSDPRNENIVRYFRNARFFHPMMYFFQFVESGLCTEQAIPIFERFFGEPLWPQQDSTTDDIHQTDFIMDLMNAATANAHAIMESCQSQWKYSRKLEIGKKASIFVRHNALIDLMKTVNKFGPNPVFDEAAKDQHLYSALQ